MPPRHIPVTTPTRLDKLLAQSLDISRIEANRLLARGVVTVNGMRASERHKGVIFAPGNSVTVTDFTPPLQREVIPRPDLPLQVLSQGEGWLIVNKPAGVGVHPFEPDENDSVLNAVIARHPKIQGVGEAGVRSGVVHRLDLDTTGTLLFATQQATWERFRKAFTEHETRKTYLAIVEGELTGSRSEQLNLTIAQHRPARVGVVDPSRDGYTSVQRNAVRLCTLSWRAVQPLRGATLIEIELGTGFLHQIRATFTHLGYPVVGDKFYGATLDAPRTMLHASDLRVLEAVGHADLPADMQAKIAELSLDA